jgi:hypothetical protein
MKIKPTKYEIGDQVLVTGSQLRIERVLTISDITIYIKKIHDELTQETRYYFEESKWQHVETDIIKKV